MADSWPEMFSSSSNAFGPLSVALELSSLPHWGLYVELLELSWMGICSSKNNQTVSMYGVYLCLWAGGSLNALLCIPFQVHMSQLLQLLCLRRSPVCQPSSRSADASHEQKTWNVWVSFVIQSRSAAVFCKQKLCSHCILTFIQHLNAQSGPLKGYKRLPC